MFLLNIMYVHIESLFFKSRKNEKSNYNDNLEIFFKFYIFINNNELYFSKFFKKFNLGFNSNFLYLYFLYYLSKKNKLINGGDFIFFFFMTFFLNKSFFLKTFKVVNSLDFFYKSKNTDIYINENWKKQSESAREFFNVKLKKIKNSYAFLNIKSFLIIIPDTLKVSTVKFNSTSLVKYINNSTDYSILFLRKNKSFNKGRYSRNRQNYRTGVYWCLYVNVIALFGLYFLFYRFTFNFGYLWWLFYCLPASFVIPHAVRNKLYNYKVFYNYTVEYFNFIYNAVNIIFFNKK